MRPGDIAVIKTDDDDGEGLAGKTCTIVHVDQTRPDEEGYDDYGVLVKVDGWNKGHMGQGGPCGNRDCWWVKYNNLRPFVDYEQTNSMFDKLYEQKNEEHELTVNDLLCYREDPLNKAHGFVKNKCYPIEYIDYDDNSLGIINDAGSKTIWSIYKRDGLGYEDWFYVIPKDIQNMDFFGKLDEQENTEHKPRIGDTLYCHKPIFPYITVDKPYRVVNTLATLNRSGIRNKDDAGGFSITNDKKQQHRFSYSQLDPAYWENWLSFVPTDMRDVDFFKGLYEQEDDFEWAKELTEFPEVVITNRGGYYPTNTNVMLKMEIPGVEEFNQKYGKHWWDTDDYQNFISTFDWDNNKGDDMELFLHQHVSSLGIPENGDICYLINNMDTNGYDEVISHLVRKSDGKHFIINADGYRPARKRISKIREQEDELEWARDLVSGVENYWDVFKQSSPKNLNKLKFKLIPKSNGSDYFKESLDSCSFNGNVEWWFKQVFKINKIKQMVRSGSDCEAGFNFGMDLDEDVLSAQLVKCLTDETDYDLPYWINEDMVDIIVIE